MKLGAFSISLAVKNLEVSKAFYEKLDFKVFAGALDKGYLIMKNGDTLIGLFEGMLEENMLTFNPGWDQEANSLRNFDDVRKIQKSLRSKGIKMEREADEDSNGPTSFVIRDPDGNMLLVDQHV